MKLKLYIIDAFTDQIFRGNLLEMEFPAYDLKSVEVTVAMEEAIGIRPAAAYMGRELLYVLDNEENALPDCLLSVQFAEGVTKIYDAKPLFEK